MSDHHLSPSPGSSSSKSRRKCSIVGCGRSLPDRKYDAHNICLMCRPICQPGRPCNECKDWPEEQRRATLSYQVKMANQRVRQARLRAKKAQLAFEYEGSSISPFDSASNVPSSNSSARVSALESRFGKVEEAVSSLMSYFRQSMNPLTQIQSMNVKGMNDDVQTGALRTLTLWTLCSRCETSVSREN